jgi:hypothetical protein
MYEEFPEGPALRFPGRMKPKKKRVALAALGPFHQVCGDGHEKLGALALRMGTVGLPIYGFRDMWSGEALLLKTIPNCRTAAALGHLLLDFWSDTGCT